MDTRGRENILDELMSYLRNMRAEGQRARVVTLEATWRTALDDL